MGCLFQGIVCHSSHELSEYHDFIEKKHSSGFKEMGEGSDLRHAASLCHYLILEMVKSALSALEGDAGILLSQAQGGLGARLAGSGCWYWRRNFGQSSSCLPSFTK